MASTANDFRKWLMEQLEEQEIQDQDRADLLEELIEQLANELEMVNQALDERDIDEDCDEDLDDDITDSAYPGEPGIGDDPRM